MASVKPDFTENDKVKLAILRELLRAGELTVNGLRVATGHANYHSVQRALKFLVRLDLVKLEERKVGTKRYGWVSLTVLGETVAKRLMR